MLIPGMDAVTENSAMFITSCFYCIGKNVFMLIFAKPSAFRISRTAFLGFCPFRDFSLGISIPATTRRQSILILFL